MRNDKTYLQLLSAILISASLVACGGGGSDDDSKDDNVSDSSSETTGDTPTPTDGSSENTENTDPGKDPANPDNNSGTTADSNTQDNKFKLAETAASTSNIFAIVDTVMSATSNIGAIQTTKLTECLKGTGTLTVTDTAPLKKFNSGDSIVTTYDKCIDKDGTEKNGSISYTGTTSGENKVITAAYRFKAEEVDTSSHSFNGTITIIPSTTPAYNSSDAGSLQISIDNFKVQYDNSFTTYKKGEYSFVLDGNRYTYKLDHEVASDTFKGTIKAKTDSNGFTGTHTFNSEGEFVVSSPNAGSMTITFPDNSTALLTSNADSKTYVVTIDGTPKTGSWDWQ